MATNDFLFQKAVKFIPGGVNSPVRAFKAVNATPIFVKRAKGSRVWDESDKCYIDYVGSYGPMILGHADPDVLAAVKRQVDSGLSFGSPTILETKMAEFICNKVPWIEKIRMVNSGTEAVMSAIRLARGATGRNKVVKFEGCYHGHVDSLLVKAGSGALTYSRSVSSTPGVTSNTVSETIVAPFNNIENVVEVFKKHGDSIAAVIVEPIAGNMGCVVPKSEFLSGLRRLCDEYGSLLIMDEVMTGFRVHPLGAQGLFDVSGDITCFGKIIGGGMPVGAFGGRADLMDNLSPAGNIYQAGTLSGNPIAMIAGLTTLQKLDHVGFYDQLADKTNELVSGIKSVAKDSDLPIVVNSVCGMFSIFITENKSVCDYGDVADCDNRLFIRYFNGMLTKGISFAPSVFESAFISSAHTKRDIEQTLDVIAEVFRSLN